MVKKDYFSVEKVARHVSRVILTKKVDQKNGLTPYRQNAYFATFLNRYFYGQEWVFFFQESWLNTISRFILPKNKK